MAWSGDSASAAADLIGSLVPGASLADQPQRLSGGRSAEIYRFQLTDGPDDLRGRELVLRLLPDTTTSLAEAVIQGEVAKLGFDTPTIHRLARSAGADTRSWTTWRERPCSTPIGWEPCTAFPITWPT